MQEPVTLCGETANLAVAEDDRVVVIGHVETHEAIRAFFRPGTQPLFHAYGIGEGILAHRAPAQVAASLKRSGMPRFTDCTLTTLPALLVDLSLRRARGWAVDDEERNPGMSCVGATAQITYAIAGRPSHPSRYGPSGDVGLQVMMDGASRPV